eukprot:1139189-Pelagomonas_calceolata.AAC.3
MLDEDVSPAADHPDFWAVGQPSLVTLSRFACCLGVILKLFQKELLGVIPAAQGKYRSVILPFLKTSNDDPFVCRQDAHLRDLP